MPRLRSLRSLVSIIGCAAVLSGCGGLLTFDTSLTGQTTIQKGTLLEQALPMDFSGLGGIQLSQTQAFQNQGVTPGEVDSIKMKSFTLEVTDPPSGQDLSFLDSIEFDVSADGLPTKRIAESEPGAFQGARSVSLTVDDVELKPYATAPNFSITSKATANKRPDNDTTVKATVVLHVIPHL